ncbi:hypothetical protein XENORESO_020235 [Xenotaenia resolanae]|uniref:Uncharacterized protein n=1 Tax=Xenotaenia resolanae TaxID=208358 RepID=A0ABV0WZC7_9TELE
MALIYNNVVSRHPTKGPTDGHCYTKNHKDRDTSLCQTDYNHWKREGVTQVAEMEGLSSTHVLSFALMNAESCTPCPYGSVILAAFSESLHGSEVSRLTCMM